MAAQVRKYDTLPDLDSAPDTYESPAELGEDTDRATPLSPSFQRTRSSSRDDEPESPSDNESTNGTLKPSRVDTRTNHPENARGVFSSSRLDARGVDFSDRIGGSRKSYRVPLALRYRRRRRGQNGDGYIDEYDDVRDDYGDEESFSEKVARLRREIEEVKIESDRIANEDDELQSTGRASNLEQTQGEIKELGELLNALHKTAGSSSFAPLAGARNSQSGDKPAEPAPTQSPSMDNQHISNEEVDRVLLKAANFETRLSLLEAALGINSSTLNSNSKPSKAAHTSILSTLALLENQFSTLSNTSIPSIESMSSKIDQLTADAVKLEEARSAARSAQEALATKSPGSTPHKRPESSGNETTVSTDSTQIPEDVEHIARIDSLFGALSSIESMSSLLPSVLDRLKSLRVLHTDAAAARENLEGLEKTQARVQDEIKQWREGLEQAEKAFKESDDAGNKNLTIVKGWVNDLGQRVETFEK